MKPWYHGLDPGEHLLLPSDWEECFSHAMRRVAVTINHQRLQCPNLNVGDPYLKARIGEQDAKLFYERIDVPKKPGQLDSDEMLKGEFADWFYGELSPSNAGMYIRVNSRVTWAFLRGTYRSLRYPLYTAAQLGFEGVKAFRSPRAQMAVMGVNYLVKNLWHNYVHVKSQKITHNNFHDFRGRARFQSDFEADNCATLLLVRSYGLPVIANSVADVDKSHTKILELLRRNRCNDVFTERSKVLKEIPSDDQIEWEYCRAIAVYLSGWLVASGRAASTLSVYICHRGGGHFLAAEVNGNYFSTAVSASGLPKERPSSDLRERVATAVDEQYRALLCQDKQRRRLAIDALKIKFRQLGIS